jgi:hypothetical protein
MVVPEAARAVAAVFGALLVITAAISLIGTIIVPRPVGGWLTRLVDHLVNGAFTLAMVRVASYKRRDRILASQAAAILLAQLIAWLAIFFVGYSLLLWPMLPHGITTAFVTAGPALCFPLGDYHDHPADRLPAHALLCLQPKGNRGITA